MKSTEGDGMTTAAQEIRDTILSEVVEGECEVDEALYALKHLQTLAEDHNDIAAIELFRETEAQLIADSEEVEETDEPDDE